MNTLNITTHTLAEIIQNAKTLNGRRAQIRAIVTAFPLGSRQCIEIEAQRLLSAKTERAAAYYMLQLQQRIDSAK